MAVFYQYRLLLTSRLSCCLGYGIQLVIEGSHYLTLYRMVMPIGTPFLKEKINN